MTTNTAPRIVASDDKGYTILADAALSVLASRKHEWTDIRHTSILRTDAGITLTVTDPTDRATIWMTREEARLLAQAILDATA